MTGRPDRMQWGFSSLGAPDLSLREFCELAHKYKLDFLELRAVRRTIALPDYFRDHAGELAVPPAVEIRVLSTDLRLTEAMDADIDAYMRYVELAKTWSTPYLRVFGGGNWDDPISREHLQRAAKTVMLCRQRMDKRGFSGEMLLETHSGFSSSTLCRKLNEQLDRPLGILWDSHHTWKLAGESPRNSWREIGAWIRHIHYKDSVPDPDAKDGYRYVVPGEGQFPTADLLRMLVDMGYQGGVSLEWNGFGTPICQTSMKRCLDLKK